MESPLKDFWLNTFLAGVLVTIVSGVITEFIRHYSHHVRLWRLRGLWVEYIEGQPNRPYSIANLKFRLFKGYYYDGINFVFNGQKIDKFYSWRSELIHLDTNANRILYVYSVAKNNTDYDKEGFGVSRFISHPKNNKKMIFSDGYFIDADEILAFNLTGTFQPSNSKTSNKREVKFWKAQDLADKLHFKLGNQSESKLIAFVERINEDHMIKGKLDFNTPY